MVTEKMISAFKNAEGGLFSAVEKADVGDAVVKMKERGVALMSWADPFYPDPSMPPHVAEAMIESIHSGFASHYTTPIGNSELKAEIAKKRPESEPGVMIMFLSGTTSSPFTFFNFFAISAFNSLLPIGVV